ncbi:glucan endo-1,3-beta-glucosidase-like [Phragmites australis]|uniref:glucan endo-1,3-beta-glucosidase-like n=1 Tax=Phragmites australis TaxID=29695 RepID=UPI002D76F8F2|nr:glucan endo-1,3-beta-glucosidase-like [Phragmites australis]
MLLPLLLLLGAIAGVHGADLPIGVNYGANADNLPTPAAVASFLATKTTINRVKLFDANPAFLSAFAANAPAISLAVSLPNSVLPALADKATGLDAARGWVRDNLAAQVAAGANVTLLLAGNEILGPTIDPNLVVALLPAMRRLAQALKLEGLPRVRVTTPHYLGILAPSDGIPSNARFRPGFDNKILAPMLRFLRDTASPLMVNAYPYFSYNAQTLDYAIFRPNRGIYDPATKLNYTSMFDAQMDAIYTAMKKLGFADVEIAVGEAGWPTKAESGQVGVGPEEARDFNAGMIRVCSGGKGTPLMPGKTFETYIFSLFDENQKPGPIAERNFGIFNPDFTPKYDLGLLRQGSSGAPNPSPNPSPKPSPNPSTNPSPSGGGKWCVVKAGANATDLQNNINYACGYIDCKPIQSGGACFDPNNVQSHASYVMNAYYQAKGRHDYDCDFKGTGVVTSNNPSYGSCKYVS